MWGIVGIIVAGHCNGNTGAHVQVGWQLDLAGEVPVDDSIRVSRPVVESVWLEQSSSPGCRPRECRLSLPGSVWLERSSSPGCALHTGQLSLPGSVWLERSSSPGCALHTGVTGPELPPNIFSGGGNILRIYSPQELLF